MQEELEFEVGTDKSAQVRWLGRSWLLGCVALAALLGYQAFADRTPELQTKSIQDLVRGDVVLAADPESGELTPRPVLAAFGRDSDHLRILSIRSADGNIEQTLKTTDEHPFWTRAGWRTAGQLCRGDEVLQTDLRWATVTSTVREEHPEGVPVYNLTVVEDHTYFVAAMGSRALAVLTHNNDQECPEIPPEHPGFPILNREFGSLTPQQVQSQIVDRIRDAATQATEVTEGLGVPRTRGRFGSDAHRNFELLLADVNVDLAVSGSPYRIRIEPFRSPGGVPDARRAADSLGFDAVLEYDGVPIRAFDLKTGGPMSAARRAELARRFDVPENAVEELFR